MTSQDMWIYEALVIVLYLGAVVALASLLRLPGFACAFAVLGVAAMTLPLFNPSGDVATLVASVLLSIASGTLGAAPAIWWVDRRTA